MAIQKSIERPEQTTHRNHVHEPMNSMQTVMVTPTVKGNVLKRWKDLGWIPPSEREHVKDLMPEETHAETIILNYHKTRKDQGLLGNLAPFTLIKVI